MHKKNRSPETPRPSLVKKNPENHKPTRLEAIRIKLETLKLEAAFYWQQYVPRQKVPVKVSSDRFQSYETSDYHIGAPSSETAIIQDQIEAVIDRPYMLWNHMDDPIDGSKPGGGNGGHAATIDQPALVEAGVQFDMFKEILLELDERGQLGSFSDATGQHAGWSRAIGIDLYRTLPDDLKNKALAQGGELEYQFPDGSKEVELVYHNPGGGGSEQNPLAANKKRLAERYTQATTVKSGHNHGRWGLEQDVNQVGDVIFTGMACGTTKGISPDQPDPFMLDANYPSRGSGIIGTHIDIDGNRVVIPVLRLSQADKLWAGLEMLELTEKHGITNEVQAQMKDQLGDEVPTFTLERYGSHDSRLKEDHFGKGTEDHTKHWTRIVYETGTKLPLQLRTVNNLGAGGSTSDMELLFDNVLNDAEKNPQILILFLRQLLAKDTPKNPDRVEIVEKLIKDLGGVPGLNEGTGQMKTVCLLYDAVLRSEKWKAKIGPTKIDGDDEEEVSEELQHRNGKYFPATELEKALDFLMIDNKGELVIRTPSGEYSFSLHDKLGHSGSLDKPMNGLQRMEMRHIEQGGHAHDVVIGGHMPIASVAVIGGVREVGERGILAPGHYSEWVDLGKGDAQIASAPGQSITILPGGDEKTWFLSPNIEQSRLVLDVLTLEEGARQTSGVKEWMKRLGKRNGRKHFTPK